MRLAPRRRWAILGTALTLTFAAVKWVASDEVIDVQTAQSTRNATTDETSRQAEIVPRIDLDRLRRTPHETPRTDPFAQKNWTVAARQETRVAPPSRPAPKAPPLPFTYFGKAVEAGRVTVFLARGDNNYVVRAGETLEGTYRVERIDERAVVFMYLPLGTRQELVLGGTE